MDETRGGHPAGTPARSTYAGILLCSAGVLMAEVLLTRIFSFTIWYHLAYLTISTALLGFGAAGSLLASRPELVERNPRRLAALGAAAAGASLLGALWILGRHPIDPSRLLSDPGTLSLGLLGYYAAVTLPFFLAGLAIATPLAAHPERANRLYAADLLGAGIGCSFAVAGLTWLDGPGAVVACAAVFVAAAALYAPGRRAALAAWLAAGLLAAGTPLAGRVLEFVPTESKQLGKSYRDPGLEMLYTRWSPVNRVDVYRVGQGLRGGWWAVGISDTHRVPMPRTLSIQYDGHNGTDVYEVRNEASLALLDHHILRTPYVLGERPRVLVIGVGGGIDVQNALRRGAERVTAVDLQPITIELHRGQLAKWTGGTLLRPEVELVAAEGRHYVRSTDRTFDLVQMTGVDTFSAQTTGAYVLAESYLYTVEAFQDYLAKLADGGLLSIVIGDLPPRNPEMPPPLVTRLALVAREALRREGAADPPAHLMMVAKRSRLGGSGGSYLENLLVKKEPFRPDEIEQVRSFAREDGFELRLAPAGSSDAALARVVHAPPDRLGAILDEQAFSVDAVTDDRPFFFNVVRWGTLLAGERSFALFPGSVTGQLVLFLMLAQALLLGGLLILAPLVRGRSGALPWRTSARFLLYFLGLGVGFLLIEISFVQKYVLLLGYPTYSLSVTIFSLLVFASLGSYLSQRAWGRDLRRFLFQLLGVTAALVLAEVLLLPWIRDRSLAAPLWVRIGATVALQLPIGVALGMYFPTGLELLRRRDPRLVPWAWAVNGVGSVAASVLAVLLAMRIGFSGVALVAITSYAIGTLALISTLRPREQRRLAARGAAGPRVP